MIIDFLNMKCSDSKKNIPCNTFQLYTKKSNLYTKDSITSQFTKSVGSGLFTKVQVNTGECIVTFNGENITNDLYKLRTDAGLGGYMIRLTKQNYLDCYTMRMQNKCFASLANSALKCYDKKNNIFAKNNSKLRIYKVKNTKTWIASLIATKKITANSEILWPYGKSYVFPEKS